jgi:histidyl-tRNA synthetase
MINKVRGTQDLYGKKINKLQHIVTNFTRIANLYGYSQIRTPILENIETFVRSVGETSDIVKKEFYNFIDKGGREVALRPEGTAPVIRCVIEEKLLYSLPKPLKFYYTGPMFRYERPQSGRYREFDQFGYEIIDSNTIYDDFEIIKLNVDSLKSVGIMDVTIKINNLGTFDSREK